PLRPFPLVLRRPPTPPLFPYTTLFRSGVAFVGAVIAAAVLKADVFQLPVPIGHNPDASAAGRSIGTLFVAWYVLSHVLKQRWARSEEHTSELQSRENLVCRLLLEKKE